MSIEFLTCVSSVYTACVVMRQLGIMAVIFFSAHVLHLQTIQSIMLTGLNHFLALAFICVV